MKRELAITAGVVVGFGVAGSSLVHLTLEAPNSWAFLTSGLISAVVSAVVGLCAYVMVKALT